ncbi:hypothetical protein VTN02DRAFT_1937 [Thermoascus thermophilus]
MPYSSQTVMFGLFAALGALSFILSVLAWHAKTTLFLPLPTSLTAVGTLLPLLTFAIPPIYSLLRTAVRSRKSPNEIRSRLFTILLPVLSHLLTLVPTAVATLALTYLVPGDILNCRLENLWQSYYHTKNERAIRGIQYELQCCGLRSVRDRAWPFKDGSRGYGDGECEKRFGYGRSCLALWRGEEQRVAGMVFVAAVVVWLVNIGVFYFNNHRRTSWINDLGEDEEADDNRQIGIDDNPRLIEYTDRVEEANEDEGREGSSNGSEPHTRPLLSDADTWRRDDAVERHAGNRLGGPAVHPSGLGATDM